VDWVKLVIPLTIGLLTWMNGINVLRSGRTSQDGVPVGMMFFFGSICLLAAAGDVRMLLHGGVSGAAKGTRRRSGQGQRVSNARLTRRRANSPTRRTTYRGSDALSATAAITTEKALAGWLGQTVHHGTRRLRLSVTQSKFGRMRRQKESTRQRLVPSGAECSAFSN